MNKSYTIAGIGVCLGKKPGFDALAEAVITGTDISKKQLDDSLPLAVKEALQYTSQKSLCVMTDTALEQRYISELGLGEQKLCGSLREMLEAAPENALLLSSREEGWIAVVLTQEESGFARLEITDGGAEEENGLMQLLLFALEIRYTLHLDKRETMYRFWDAKGGRSKELHCGGLRCTLTEPKVPAIRTYVAKKYLLPIVFHTAEEAVQKLNLLKKADSLKNAMEGLLSDLKDRDENSNTIVLLADSFAALNANIDDLLKNKDRLMEEGFVWKKASGSVYIRRSCLRPEIVFMNPPGGMFNAYLFQSN